VAGIRCTDVAWRGGAASTSPARDGSSSPSTDRADGGEVEDEEGKHTIDDGRIDHASTLTPVLGFSFVILSICALSCFLIRERLAHAWRVWAAVSGKARRTKSMTSTGARRPQRLQEVDELEDGEDSVNGDDSLGSPTGRLSPRIALSVLARDALGAGSPQPAAAQPPSPDTPVHSGAAGGVCEPADSAERRPAG